MKPLWCWRCQRDMPMLDERWVGGDGIATFNGKAARTSGCKALHRARLFATLSERITGPVAQTIAVLAHRVALRRPGAACYADGLLGSRTQSRGAVALKALLRVPVGPKRLIWPSPLSAT